MLLKVILLALVLVVSVMCFLYGRSLWYPVTVKFGGSRTVDEVVAIYGRDARARLRPYFSAAGVNYPPESITLLAIKDTASLELWANDSGNTRFIRRYSVKAASGTTGPKLREGDHQVPEGIYHIDGFNPNSSFHLSMKLNYPNAFDKKHAQREGRHSPGSNIFIHGKASSVGCLAMGDTAIEELFILVAEVGRQKVSVLIAPADPRLTSLVPLPSLPWTRELYQQITSGFQHYQPVPDNSEG